MYTKQYLLIVITATLFIFTGAWTIEDASNFEVSSRGGKDMAELFALVDKPNNNCRSFDGPDYNRIPWDILSINTDVLQNDERLKDVLISLCKSTVDEGTEKDIVLIVHLADSTSKNNLIMTVGTQGKDIILLAALLNSNRYIHDSVNSDKPYTDLILIFEAYMNNIRRGKQFYITNNFLAIVGKGGENKPALASCCGRWKLSEYYFSTNTFKPSILAEFYTYSILTDNRKQRVSMFTKTHLELGWLNVLYSESMHNRKSL